ncbi:hypothetical protein BH11MYX2_BH11MYX2_14970 [soil metagenome]
MKDVPFADRPTTEVCEAACNDVRHCYERSHPHETYGDYARCVHYCYQRSPGSHGPYASRVADALAKDTCGDFFASSELGAPDLT